MQVTYSKLSASHPPHRLWDNTSSAVHICLFNAFAGLLFISAYLLHSQFEDVHLHSNMAPLNMISERLCYIIKLETWAMALPNITLHRNEQSKDKKNAVYRTGTHPHKIWMLQSDLHCSMLLPNTSINCHLYSNSDSNTRVLVCWLYKEYRLHPSLYNQKPVC
jgi:hypothetical protein